MNRPVQFGGRDLREGLRIHPIRTQTFPFFVAIMPTTTLDNPVSLYGVQGQPLQALCAAVIEPGADGFCWHQMLPLGHFRGHHTFPDFTVTPVDLQEIIANFDAGLPLAGGGVPIDEDGIHQQRSEGAFGWIRKLEARADGLYGGIEWGEDGLAALKAKRYKHVSPVVFLQNLNPFPATEWMPVQGSLLFSCALTTRPYFYQQPELAVAATQCLPMEAAMGGDMGSRDAMMARSKQWGIEVRPDGHLTPPAAYAAACPSPNDYGDPTNFMYPLKPEARIKAAAVYMSANYGKYKQAASRRQVWTRIVSAEKAAGIKHGPVPALDPLLPANLRPQASRR
jgi:hypothetical protein